SMKRRLAELQCRAVVSDSELCRSMFDKRRSAEWFRSNDIPQPGSEGPPWIVKHRFGYGSRGQVVVRSREERELFFSTRSTKDYLVQNFVEGPEYTIDAYVDCSGRMVEALSRRRIEVVGGEVETSETEKNPGALAIARQVLAVRGWEGPI